MRNQLGMIGVGFFIFLSQGAGASASIHKNSAPGRLPTRLSSFDLAREALDEKHYPHFMKFLRAQRSSRNIFPTDPRNRAWIRSSHYFRASPEMWDGLFQAATADRLTLIRAFSLLAREIKRNGMVVFGPGKQFEEAMERNHIDLGLAVPAKNLGGVIWSPDPHQRDPEFQVHIKIFYTKPFIHQFPDEILPADLKIGYVEPQSYWLDGQEYRHCAMDADIYYGPKNGVGFRNVRGVGGLKRGIMGVFQKVLFFLPDAVDSMTIREERGEMVTEALINTTVKDFEKNPLYSIKVKEITK